MEKINTSHQEDKSQRDTYDQVASSVGRMMEERGKMDNAKLFIQGEQMRHGRIIEGDINGYIKRIEEDIENRRGNLESMQLEAGDEAREINDEYEKLIEDVKRTTEALTAFQKDKLGMRQNEDGESDELEKVRKEISEMK